MSIKLKVFEKSSDFGYYQAGEIIKQIREFQKQKPDEMFRLGISYGSANNIVVKALANLIYVNRENGLGINFDKILLVCTEALWPDTSQIKGLPGYEFLQNIRQLENALGIKIGDKGLNLFYPGMFDEYAFTSTHPLSGSLHTPTFDQLLKFTREKTLYEYKRLSFSLVTLHESGAFQGMREGEIQTANYEDWTMHEPDREIITDMIWRQAKFSARSSQFDKFKDMRNAEEVLAWRQERQVEKEIEEGQRQLAKLRYQDSLELGKISVSGSTYIRADKGDKPISASSESVAKKYTEDRVKVPEYFISPGYQIYSKIPIIITTIGEGKAEGLKRILEATFVNPHFGSAKERLEYIKTREFRNVPSGAIITRSNERQGRDTVICTDTAGASKCLQISPEKLAEWGVEIIHNPKFELDIPSEELFDTKEIFDYYKELHGEKRNFGSVR